jgi:MFS superfamily sulfate permease-like transporter
VRIKWVHQYRANLRQDQVSHRWQTTARPVLVIEANSIIEIDYTAAQILRRVFTELRATNIVVALARLSDERAQAQGHRTGLIDTIGPERVFMSVEEAVRRLDANANPTHGI